MERLSITYEDFQKLAEEFVVKSKKIRDNWELRLSNSLSNATSQVYLVKKTTRNLARGKSGEVIEDDDLENLAGDISTLEDADLAYLDTKSIEKNQSDDVTVDMEYHILHSMSYQVPLLFFSATYSDGQALSLPNIWQLLSPNFVSSDTDKWSLVTQQEHPYLGRPFYHIHPCHTAQVMGKAMQCSVEDANYLITWLSTFGHLIGLDLPMEYAQS